MTQGPLNLKTTCQDAASDPWDPLYLCDVVVGEEFITGGIEGIRIAEGPPQFGGNGFIVYLNELCTDVISFGGKSSISKQTDTAKKSTHHVPEVNITADQTTCERTTYGKVGGSMAVLMTPA